MPAPASTAEFTDIILKSGVVEEPRLTAYLAKLTPAPADPSALAGLLVRDGLLTYFQAEQLLQGKWKRFFIGKYKVLEKLGAGGMGQVFLCEHKLMKRRVAVKVLPAAKAKEPAALERFHREARAVAALDHPNIVRAYDIDEDGGLHFLVMEFVDGSNLHDLVRKFGPMNVSRACHYIYGAAVGLHHAAEMGLIHRDIKPANILVDRGGVVKVLDMGLARFFNPDESDMLTKKFDENVLGTADFLAPEQALDSHTVDIRADIYGLGGTFYYLLTGQAPFPDGTVAQKLLWHQTRDPKSIREIRREVPEELAAIVARMLAKNPADRYQTPAELMAALGPWVQTPIAPPSAEEMPQLSAAAVGSSRTGGPGSGAPLSVGGAARSGQMPAIAATPAPAGTRLASPVAVAPTLPRPIVRDEPSGFDTLGTALADTRRNGNGADTEGDAPRRSGQGKTAPRPATAAGGKSIVLFVLAGLLLVAGGVTALLVLKPWEAAVKPDKGTEQPPVEVHRWYVTAGGTSPNAATTRKTLTEAVRAARSGETIILLDDRFEGPAVVVPSTTKNLRIEAGNAAKSVVWVYKPEAGSSLGVLDIKSGEGVTIEGLVIEVNGAHDTGVHLSGFCSGLTLGRVTVRGAKATGFRLNNIDTSTKDGTGKPVRLAACRATGCPVGVAIGGTGRLANKGVTVEGCRFDTAETALRVDGPCEAIEFKNNRVFKVARGVEWATAVPSSDRVQLAVERNTFHTVREAGVKLTAALTGPKQEIAVSRNFFAATAALAAGPSPAGLKAADNARDKASKEGPIPLKALESDFTFPATDANDDATFLRAAGKPGVFGAD